MPCYDSRDDEPRIIYETGVDPYKVIEQANRADKAEAMLCALLTEIQTLSNPSLIIANASRHGLVDIMSFWNKHQAKDKTRLAAALHKFSVDEQKVLKELLNNSKEI